MEDIDVAHAYNKQCNCERCTKETTRRDKQRAAVLAKPTVYSSPRRRPRRKQHATREEQHARYIDCGPGAWDDR